MKDINGKTLEQPYYDLARMRREQQKGSHWDNIYGKKYAENGRLDDAFAWGDTPELDDFWVDTDCGNHPSIPDTSLAELEAWRKEKGINKDTPSDTTDFKGMYEEVRDKLVALQTKYDELVTKHQEILDAFHDSAELTAEPSNFIVECAMAAMQGMLANPSESDVSGKWVLQTLGLPENTKYDWLIHYPQFISKLSFDYAEAMAAEGRKRGYLPNTEKEKA